MTDKAGEHVGRGIAWLGFWLMAGMSSMELIPDNPLEACINEEIVIEATHGN